MLLKGCLQNAIEKIEIITHLALNFLQLVVPF
jgi:hypothetical protein